MKLNEKIIKKIIKDVINESLSPNFNLNTFKKLQDDEKIEYLRYHLGTPIHEGSSRTAYQLNDKYVIKVANGYDEFYSDQNRAEVMFYQEHKDMKIIPKVLDYADDYRWIISEFVIPAKEIDFNKILGINFCDIKNTIITKNDIYTDTPKEDEINFRSYQGKNKLSITMQDFDYYVKGCDFFLTNEKIKLCEYLKKTNEWFSEYNNFVLEMDGECDFKIVNFGLAMRNGKPYIVVLDYGINGYM